MINQRLKSIEVRKELTDEWENRGVKKGQQFATLTDMKKENLRDNMTNLELVLNMLAEATTTEISKEKNPKTFDDNKIIAKQGEPLPEIQERQLKQSQGKKL